MNWKNGYLLWYSFFFNIKESIKLLKREGLIKYNVNLQYTIDS